MNPAATHWVRMGFWLFALSPVLALLVALTRDAPFGVALTITLYMWAFVCVILALVALGGLVVRLLGRGIRGLRR